MVHKLWETWQLGGPSSKRIPAPCPPSARLVSPIKAEMKKLWLDVCCSDPLLDEWNQAVQGGWGNQMMSDQKCHVCIVGRKAGIVKQRLFRGHLQVHGGWCGLTQQAGKHHAAVCSPPTPVSWGKEFWKKIKKKKTCWHKDSLIGQKERNYYY